MHKNNKDAIGNYCIYAIYIDFKIFKIGKADLDRVTKYGVPVRIHQQISLFRKLFGVKRVGHEILIYLYKKTTQEALEAENDVLKAYKNQTGELPKGNQ